MHRYTMLTENRKRRRSCDGEEEPQVLPQAKRSGGYSFLPEVGRDVWDSESSSSDSSGISSPEQMTAANSSIQSSDQRRLHVSQAPCSPLTPTLTEDPAISLSQNNVLYDHINRILREAHFNSLQTRGQQGRRDCQ